MSNQVSKALDPKPWWCSLRGKNVAEEQSGPHHHNFAPRPRYEQNEALYRARVDDPALERTPFRSDEEVIEYIRKMRS